MAKPKGKNRGPGPKKSQTGKQAQVHKMIQEAKAAAEVKPKIPWKVQVKLPTTRTGGLATSPANPAKLDVDAPSVEALSRTIDQAEITSSITVRLPPRKTFPFLDLPFELQDEVYQYLFVDPMTFHVKFIAARCKALTYSLPNQLPCCQPHVQPSAKLRRRQLDYPKRAHASENKVPAYRIPTGFLQLLHVHPRIAERAAKYFYRLHTFRFTNIGPLRAFLNMLPASSKEEIRNIELIHSTRPWSRMKDDCLWKWKHDVAWAETLDRVGMEFAGLRRIKLDLTLRDLPQDIDKDATWRRALEALEDLTNLEDAEIKIRGLSQNECALEVEAHIIEHELLDTECGENCHALRRKKTVERLLPKNAWQGRIRTLKITSIPPPRHPRRS
ncbi:MAG: hypothetical protein Q9191_006714 [Dirinaria sp. TL-2023a]